MDYIWQNPNWPNFTFDESAVDHAYQEYLRQKIESDAVFGLVDPSIIRDLNAQALANDVVSSSAIEGVVLSYDSVYSSVAKALDIQFEGVVNKADKSSENQAALVLDALNGTDKPLDESRVFNWHELLFRGVAPRFRPSNVGAYRDQNVYVVNYHGNMRQDVLFQGIPTERIQESMSELFSWIRKEGDMKPLVKSAIALLWLVTIHPFGDGNGRISRALADSIIATEWHGSRVFSVSSRILKRKNEYYDQLYKVQHSSNLDVTSFVVWYMDMVTGAIRDAVESCMEKIRLSRFMLTLDPSLYNSREITMLYRLASGSFFGKLTAEKYSKLMKCTSATSTRDLSHLVGQGMLLRSNEGGRTTWYRLNPEFRTE